MKPPCGKDTGKHFKSWKKIDEYPNDQKPFNIEKRTEHGLMQGICKETIRKYHCPICNTYFLVPHSYQDFTGK